MALYPKKALRRSPKLAYLNLAKNRLSGEIPRLSAGLTMVTEKARAQSHKLALST